MKNLFEGLANQKNAVVTSDLACDTSSLRASGDLTITKGFISMVVRYWSDTYRSQYPGYAQCEDTDWDILDVYIEGIKIDSISKFQEGLRNMGLESISEKINISDAEILQEIYKQINLSSTFENTYGDFKLFNALSKEQQRDVILNYSIENYEKCSAYALNQHGLSESPNTKPTLEELIKIKKNAGK